MKPLTAPGHTWAMKWLLPLAVPITWIAFFLMRSSNAPLSPGDWVVALVGLAYGGYTYFRKIIPLADEVLEADGGIVVREGLGELHIPYEAIVHVGGTDQAFLKRIVEVRWVDHRARHHRLTFQSAFAHPVERLRRSIAAAKRQARTVSPTIPGADRT